MAAAPGPKACAHCNASADDVDLSRCSGCKLRWYCGRACQKADYKAHKPECLRAQAQAQANASAGASASAAASEATPAGAKSGRGKGSAAKTSKAKMNM